MYYNSWDYMVSILKRKRMQQNDYILLHPFFIVFYHTIDNLLSCRRGNKKFNKENALYCVVPEFGKQGIDAKIRVGHLSAFQLVIGIGTKGNQLFQF